MLKKVSSSSGNSGITKALQKELEHLTKTGSPMKYSIIRGDDVADLKAAYQKIVDGTLSKSDAIKIAIEKKLVEDDDNITAKKAVEAIKKAISKPEKEIKKPIKVKTDDLDLSKKEDRLKFAERKKAQYSNDAYTGNGTAQPSQFNNPTETNAENPRERYLVPGKQKDVQMKSDITPGEQMDPVAPVASTDADKDIAFLEAKLEAAKKRKVDEDMKKIEALKSMLNSLSPELRETLKSVLTNEPEKKTELKVEALDAPALPDEIVKTEVPVKEQPMEINVNLGGGRQPSANPTMSQDLNNPNTSNPTMGQDIVASKKTKADQFVSPSKCNACEKPLSKEEKQRGESTCAACYHRLKNFDESLKGEAASKKEEKQVKSKYPPIKCVMASKECLDEIIDILSGAKDIEDLLKAEVMLQDGIIPVEHIDRAIEIWTLDKDKAKTHIDEQLKLLKDSLKLKAKFIKDSDKKTDSYWLVKSTKNEPIFKITAAQAFGSDVIGKWDMFTSERYGMKLETEIVKHGVLGVIEKYYPEATIFDQGLKNIVDSRAKVLAQVPNDNQEETETQLINTLNDPEELVEIVDSKFGWSVASQLEEILNGEYLERKNSKALKIIADFLKTYQNEENAPHIADEIYQYLNHVTASKKVAQIPTQTDMAVGEPNVEPMDLKENGANVVDHSEEIQKDLGAPALVSKEKSDELLAPTEKQPHISDLLVEILSPMIVGSEVNTPESIVQDLKALLSDDDSSSIFLGKVKQKVYELGNATKNDVTAPEKEIAPKQKIDDAMPEEMLKMQSKIQEMGKREAELKQANAELKDVIKKTGIERSAKLRAARAKRLADLRLEIELEDKDTTNDLMKLSSKEFLDKESETIKVAARLKSNKNNAFVKEAGKLWAKGAFGLSHLAEDNKEPSLIKNSKLDVSWSRAIKDKKEEE